MFNRPVKVAFVVDDVPAAIEFYTKTLDLEIEACYPSDAGDGEDFVFLKSENIYVELLPQKAMGGAPAGFHHLAFWSDDVQASLDELKTRGATVTADAFSAGVGGITLGDFEGPEGILLRLFNQKKD
jgi:catechol 2,3-dioxygenase-like lactoylglutathione lyase family enzyme